MIRIPQQDIGDAGPLALLGLYPDRARALVETALDMAGPASRLMGRALLPAGDRLSRAWLEKNRNPFLPEIDAMAAALKIDGVYLLNVCFEWGCTSGAFATPEGVTLRRVLDWLFPRLGEHIVVAEQRGEAGDFRNITWPGLSGIYQALAPGRFAAAINQAPMRRHGMGAGLDWLTNRALTRKSLALPPSHLLRLVFETAPDYAAARQMLCDTPIAVPAIFILTGMADGEGCVIERTEDAFALRQIEGDRVCATNHFQSPLNDSGQGWLARPIDSHGRARLAETMAHDQAEPFGWFTPPIANAHSRLVMNACASSGRLAVMGVEGERPVTEVFTAQATGRPR